MTQEFSIVKSYRELTNLFPLFHKFFQKTKTDYTEREFFQNLDKILSDGIIGYILEDGIPVAYGIAIKTNFITNVILILQVYSERPFYVRKMIDAAEEFARNNNARKLVALVESEKVDYFCKHYDMKKGHLLMERQVSEPEEEIPDIPEIPELEEEEVYS